MANKKTKRTKEAVLQALKTYKGLLSLAARALGVTPQTLWNYRQRWPELERAIADAEEEMLDTAELALYSKIAAGDLKSIMFFLKMKGKRRGYTAAMGQVVGSLVNVTRSAQRTSADVHGLLQDGDAPPMGTGGAVKLLEALLQQVDGSALPLAEKSRLTVALTDALLRAINADEIVKRQEALQAVLQHRKEEKRCPPNV